MTAEHRRLDAARTRTTHWKRWGPYVSERAWGTVREDYSPDGTAWEYLPHDHARSRAYRWNEDGLGGICDRHQEICLALALWNGRDPILKERLFGLTGNEGNHGEDVKEYYFYLDSTPTHSYMRMLYKYPQAAFPYAGAGRREPPARPRRARIRADRHRRLRRRPLLRRVRRVRQGRRGRPADADHRRQPRTGGGAARTCCRRSGSATPGRGATTAGADGSQARPAVQGCAAIAARDQALRPALALRRRRSRRCCSPRTRPTRAPVRRRRAALRQGRHRRGRRPRRRRRREPGRVAARRRPPTTR